METLLLVMPILGVLVFAFGRVAGVRPAIVEGTPLAELSLGFRERVRYHRGALCSVGLLMVVGGATGYLPWTVQLLVSAAALAVVQRPIRYQLTTEGAAVGQLLFRPWQEFAGYRVTKTGLPLVGRSGHGAFPVQATGPGREGLVKAVALKLPGLKKDNGRGYAADGSV